MKKECFLILLSLICLAAIIKKFINHGEERNISPEDVLLLPPMRLIYDQ